MHRTSGVVGLKKLISTRLFSVLLLILITFRSSLVAVRFRLNFLFHSFSVSLFALLYSFVDSHACVYCFFFSES